MRYFVFACRALFLRNCIGAVDNHRGPGGSRFLSDNLRPVRMMLSLTIFLVTLPSLAQNQILNPPVWRFHAGDNPAWSEPGFDDSDWTQASFRELISRPYTGGTSWYRATFPVPADFAGEELALGMSGPDEVYDLYVNGTLVGRYGSWEPTPHGAFPRHIAFPLPIGLLNPPTGHIAIRRWNGAAGLRWTQFSASGWGLHSPRIGSRPAIEALERLHPAAGAIRELPSDLQCLLFLFAASISFVLFSVQRRRAEYLYLAAFCVLAGAPSLIAIPLTTNESVMARSWGPVLIFSLSPPLANAFALLFLSTLCPRFRRILQLGAMFAAICAVLAAYSLGAQSHAATVTWRIGNFYGLAIFQLIAMWGLLLDRRPGSFAIAFCLLLDSAGWALGMATERSNLFRHFFIEAGPFRIDLRTVPGVLFVFVTLLVLYLRYRDEQVRQAAINQELSAARRMQEQLLTGSESHTAGFLVDVAYRPAREVGGDFYRAVPMEDGSLLVILGDVSGKGLDAAMLVAVILGSLANETHRNPASLLSYLNRGVIGRTGGGFITACCARFYPDGRVILANAGQIAPYVDGRELALENGLPLGISAEACYSETEVKTNAAVTFVSDGVVEARDPNGELLGFERIAALTRRKATEIAEAAQRWGQEDDITVLSVARTAKLEAATA